MTTEKERAQQEHDRRTGAAVRHALSIGAGEAAEPPEEHLRAAARAAMMMLEDRYPGLRDFVGLSETVALADATNHLLDRVKAPRRVREAALDRALKARTALRDAWEKAGVEDAGLRPVLTAYAALAEIAGGD